MKRNLDERRENTAQNSVFPFYLEEKMREIKGGYSKVLAPMALNTREV